MAIVIAGHNAIKKFEPEGKIGTASEVRTTSYPRSNYTHQFERSIGRLRYMRFQAIHYTYHIV
jgi:hypothetical protein